MKKYLLKLTAFVLLVGTLVGCSEDKVFYDESKGAAARFVDSSRLMGVTETKKEKKYEVIASTISNVDRKITASIDTQASSTTILDQDGNQVNVTDYVEIVPEKSFIPAGSYSGNVVVRFKKEYSDLTFADQIVAVIVLDAVEGASLDNQTKRLLLTVFKDCDYDPALAAGTTYSAVAVANPLDGYPGAQADPYEPVLKQNPNNKNEFTVNTLWGPNFVATVTGQSQYNGQFLYPGKIVINPEDNTLTVTGDPSNIKNGTGTYDACKNVFTYTFTQGLFTSNGYPPFTVTVTLTPKQ